MPTVPTGASKSAFTDCGTGQLAHSVIARGHAARGALLRVEHLPHRRLIAAPTLQHKRVECCAATFPTHRQLEADVLRGQRGIDIRPAHGGVAGEPCLEGDIASNRKIDLSVGQADDFAAAARGENQRAAAEFHHGNVDVIPSALGGQSDLHAVRREHDVGSGASGLAAEVAQGRLRFSVANGKLTSETGTGRHDVEQAVEDHAPACRDGDAEHRPVLNCGRKGATAQAKNENRHYERERPATSRARRSHGRAITLSVCQIGIAEIPTVQ